VTDDADLRVAVLGVGMMGAYHAATVTSRVKGARVTVVNDFVATTADRVAARTPGARVVPDPFEAIRADDVDAVIIASPGKVHHEQVLACLDRQIPVLCEKPLTTQATTSYEVVQAEAEVGRSLVQVGFMRRFDPEYVQLRALIASGDLGNPLLMHCIHRNPTVPAHFDSQMMIEDSVVHEVDAIRFLLGEEVAAVTVIKPTATALAPEGFHDPMLVVLETVSGRVVTDEIFVRTGVGYEVRTEVVGENGSATIGLDQSVLTKTVGGRWGGRITAKFLERFDTAYHVELQRWVDAARAGTIDGPGAWDGYAASAVCAAGVRAVESGRREPVQLEPRPAGVPTPALGVSSP